MSQPKPLLFKNKLLIYTQKQHLPEPKYEIVKEGPDHKAIFTATVIVDGERYGSHPSSCSSNRKAAEHAAARVALEKLCNKEGNYPSEVPKASALHMMLSSQFNSGLCKSLLQERLKKLNLPDPYYSCEESRDGPETTYEASVEIAGTKYVGGPAKSKKLATMKAARTALLAIQGQHCKSDVSAGNNPSAVLDSGIYRNLLQDQMRKLKLPDPYYVWEVSGEGPTYTYKATVRITGTLYFGGPARSKKVAAAKAARAALSAIQGQQCMSNTEHVEAHSGMKRGREVEHPSEGQKDEMNKRRTTENASAIQVEDKQSHLQQDMPVYDGQEIKPVAEHNFQDNGQKSDGVEMVQRTEEQAKQSTANVEIKPVAELNSQEIGLKSEGVEMVQRAEEQTKQSTGKNRKNCAAYFI
eukprot:PITA_16699